MLKITKVDSGIIEAVNRLLEQLPFSIIGLLKMSETI